MSSVELEELTRYVRNVRPVVSGSSLHMKVRHTRKSLAETMSRRNTQYREQVGLTNHCTGDDNGRDTST